MLFKKLLFLDCINSYNIANANIMECRLALNVAVFIDHSACVFGGVNVNADHIPASAQNRLLRRESFNIFTKIFFHDSLVIIRNFFGTFSEFTVWTGAPDIGTVRAKFSLHRALNCLRDAVRKLPDGKIEITGETDPYNVRN